MHSKKRKEALPEPLRGISTIQAAMVVVLVSDDGCR
jgi:hypothetical protein